MDDNVEEIVELTPEQMLKRIDPEEEVDPERKWCVLKLRRECMNRVNEIRTAMGACGQLMAEAVRQEHHAAEAEKKEDETFVRLCIEKARAFRAQADAAALRAYQARMELEYMSEYGELFIEVNSDGDF